MTPAQLNTGHDQTVPVSTVHDWITMHFSPQTADNSGGDITIPATQIADAAKELAVAHQGTELLIRGGYDDGVTVSQAAVVQAFGKDSAGLYHRLRNSDGDEDLTLSSAAADVTDGTLKYTVPVKVDMEGAAHVCIGIKTALAGSGGEIANSVIQVKVL